VLELADLMHQHNSNTLIQKEEQRFDKLEREEVVLRYISTSPHC
jgi:hypothetical protein